VVLICITGGTSMVIMVIIEYIQGPTATSTTIRLVGEIMQISQKLFQNLSHFQKVWHRKNLSLRSVVDRKAGYHAYRA
jgi:hypothetical protein